MDIEHYEVTCNSRGWYVHIILYQRDGLRWSERAGWLSRVTGEITRNTRESETSDWEGYFRSEDEARDAFERYKHPSTIFVGGE